MPLTKTGGELGVQEQGPGMDELPLSQNEALQHGNDPIWGRFQGFGLSSQLGVSPTPAHQILTLLLSSLSSSRKKNESFGIFIICKVIFC